MSSMFDDPIFDEHDDQVPHDEAETLDVDRPLFPPPAAPLDVARKLYTDYRINGNGLRTLVAWRGGWMRWHGTHWSEMGTAELRSGIYDRLGEVDYEQETKDGIEVKPWNPDKRKVANVVEAMAAIGHLSADVDPPSWIDLHSAAETSAARVISCQNGLLDLSTRGLVDHTPALFNVVSVPFDYQADAGPPVAWLEFLASIWGDDRESIALLQEYVGYVLSGRTDMQKMLLLIGPTRSGKGTIARMLTALVGCGHAAGPTLASLGTNFGLSPLLGKPLAIISDARLGDTPAHTIVERLLSITGEDMLTVDRKYREVWSGKLPTRFVVISNELPRFRDSSAAIANRLLILQMTKSFLGREDRTLDGRLRAELPGILSWALEGLDRLNRNGAFTVPDSSTDAANLMMDLASPVSAFVRDECVRDPQATILRDDLYHAWKRWAEDNGHQAGAKSTFGRNLRAVVPEVKSTKPRVVGVQAHGYAGIGLQSYTHNRLAPASPASSDRHAGHGHFSGSGEAGRGAGLPASDDFAGSGEAGLPASGGTANMQVNGGEAGEAGATPSKAQHSSGTAHDRYRAGKCCDCGQRPPSAGRPRCDDCHAIHVRVMARYDQ